MKLSFPNASRSYDARRRWVRFWAYDNALEIPFFLAADTLAKMVPEAIDDERGLQSAFDQHWERICKAAERVYSRNSRGSYLLQAADVT
jgi:hypothetical protein